MRYGFCGRNGAALRREPPLLLQFLGKLVLEVLPAALASVIGGAMFAHYQFAQPGALQRSAAAAAPAPAEMVQLVRDEHAMIRDFLDAQKAAARSRAAAADAAAAEARAAAHAAAAAKLAEAERRRATAALAETKATVAHRRMVASSAAAAPPLVVVGADTSANAGPVAAVAPGRPSLVAATLALPGQVVAVTLHAVSTIGGIPSWIGHRFGDSGRDLGPRPPSAAS